MGEQITMRIDAVSEIVSVSSWKGWKSIQVCTYNSSMYAASNANGKYKPSKSICSPSRWQILPN